MNTSLKQTRGLARIGVVVPVSNTNLEPDMAMLAPEGVSVHVARAGGYDVDQIPDEHQMRQYSDRASEEVVQSLKLCRSDVILYGCTSATLAQGPDYDAAFRESIETATGIAAVTAASALIDGLQALDVGRFAFTSPYVATLNDLAVDFIESFGMTCVGRCDTPQPWSNLEVAAATPERVIEMAEAADRPNAQAIVISCTDFRAVEAVPEIERRLGKPVITSNQALMASAIWALDLDVSSSPLAQQAIVRRWEREAV